MAFPIYLGLPRAPPRRASGLAHGPSPRGFTAVLPGELGDGLGAFGQNPHGNHRSTRLDHGRTTMLGTRFGPSEISGIKSVLALENAGVDISSA